jgi:hypothetical protein
LGSTKGDRAFAEPLTLINREPLILPYDRRSYMKLDKKLAQALAVGLALADLVFTEFEVALMTFGVAAILYGFTQSLEVAIVALLVPLAAKGVNLAMEQKKETFQVKDGPSIAKRVEAIRIAAPKKTEPVGVLESPEIMSSQPLMSVEAMSNEALPAESIPAAGGARVQINTPDEETVEAKGITESTLLANPVLQNGEDSEGVETALLKTGTASSAAPGNVVAVTGMAGPAF